MIFIFSDLFEQFLGKNENKYFHSNNIIIEDEKEDW